MKRPAFVLACLLLLGLTAAADVVQPAYEGQFGNPEEPALRPYKWMWHGLKSLAYQTGKGFQDGNMNFPVIGTVEIGRGLRRGTVEFAESTWKGALFAVPPNGTGEDFKDLGRWNEKLQNEPLARNVSDALFTWYYFPLLKFVDYYPVKTDEEVEQQKEEARQTREARKAAGPQPDPTKTRVERAQDTYVPDRVAAGSKKSDDGRGNLLKLAK